MDQNVFYLRSLGTACVGIPDQYADGRAAKLWEVLVGDVKVRTEVYKKFLVGLLHEHGCKRILDVACGTGVDSMLLLEEGFDVISVDASDKMLKYALKERWERRKEPAFDKWIIEEANWLTLYKDIQHLIGEGFDAVICLGNSFAHLMDNFGDQREQRKAISNFEKCVKPGGLLLIDHRNYDSILDKGFTPSKSIYYNSKHSTDINTLVLNINGKPAMVTMDYFIDITGSMSEEEREKIGGDDGVRDFRLSYYPHRLASFKSMLKDAFGEKSMYKIYGDFKELQEIDDPGFYIHVVNKPLV